MARSSNRTQQFEQLTLDAVRYNSGRGGPRRGAGRPRGARPRVMHRPRERIVARVPVHVTIRLRRGIPTLAPAAVRATVPIIVGRGLCPARLQGGALLDPARPSASTHRSAEQPLDRVWDEERRCPDRQAREPVVSAKRQGARRSLSPAAVANSTRGTTRAALRVAQSPASRRAAAQLTHSRRAAVTGSGEFRALVRRLA